MIDFIVVLLVVMEIVVLLDVQVRPPMTLSSPSVPETVVLLDALVLLPEELLSRQISLRRASGMV